MSRRCWDDAGEERRMPALKQLLDSGRAVEGSRPCPRAVVAAPAWRNAAGRLASGRLALLGLWGEPEAAHMALRDTQTGEVGVISILCPERRYPSVSERHPPALRLERTLRDLYGLTPEGLPDPRPWLDHGWGGAAAPEPYPFLPVEGDCLHQIAVGPVHAGIIEPGHFRFTASGETVVRLEQRLGYTHKGVEALAEGAEIGAAARLAGRVSGDSTVAYALAFSRAVEAALGVTAPPRAAWLRGLMAELERLANHVSDIGAICNDAAFPLLHTHGGILREQTLRACDAAFGHRMMRDCIRPGGVAADLAPDGVAALRALTRSFAQRFPAMVRVYDETPSLLDRTTGAGVLTPALARQYAAGGYVGRASGRDFDARLAMPYAPYDALSFTAPTREDGDVHARIWVRILEVEQTLALIGQILDRLPEGPLSEALPAPDAPCEGLAVVEGFRGDVLAWVRIGADGRVARMHLRDPSWFQWPLLEAAIENNIVADFPLCNKSFNCSYSGCDL